MSRTSDLCRSMLSVTEVFERGEVETCKSTDRNKERCRSPAKAETLKRQPSSVKIAMPTLPRPSKDHPHLLLFLCLFVTLSLSGVWTLVGSETLLLYISRTAPDNSSMPESLYQAVSRFALSRPSKICLTILARSPLPVDLCPCLCLIDMNTTQTSKTPLAKDRGRRSVLSCDAK